MSTSSEAGTLPTVVVSPPACCVPPQLHQELAQVFLDLAQLDSACGHAPQAATVAAHGCHAVSNIVVDCALSTEKTLHPLQEYNAAMPIVLHTMHSREEVRQKEGCE